MSTISLKIPEALDAQLDAAAQRLGESKSFVVREAIGKYLCSVPKKKASFLELAGDAIGSVEGPGDLSTNKKYMRGFGK